MQPDIHVLSNPVELANPFPSPVSSSSSSSYRSLRGAYPGMQRSDLLCGHVDGLRERLREKHRRGSSPNPTCAALSSSASPLVSHVLGRGVNAPGRIMSMSLEKSQSPSSRSMVFGSNIERNVAVYRTGNHSSKWTRIGWKILLIVTVYLCLRCERTACLPPPTPLRSPTLPLDRHASALVKAQ